MPHVFSRRTIVAAAVAAPGIAAAIGLAGMSLYARVNPDAPLFGGPPPPSMAESIAGRSGVEQTFAFIRAGQDPNALIVVRHDDYTGGADVRVSPLMLAVAARDSSAVRMLLSFGARLDLPQNRLAPCLADDIGNAEIVEIFAAERGGEPLVCPPRPDGPTPLAAWAGADRSASRDPAPR